MTTPTGRRATVALTIEVLVEVAETDGYHSTVELAKEDLRKRVLESKTFLPVAIRSERIYSDVTVQELKAATVVEPRRQWTKPTATPPTPPPRAPR